MPKRYDPTSGPIFFYTGNEGPIEEFWNNTGFIFDIAPQFKALIVFAEHRYYGESLPFGAASWSQANIGLLSVEQALADYAELIPVVKQSINASEDTIVVSFGGSYGGMLSAWIRVLYPSAVDMCKSPPPSSLFNYSLLFLTRVLLTSHFIFYHLISALAASAPIVMLTNQTPNPGFYQAVTNDFAAADARCPGLFRQAFSSLLELKSQTGGYEVISKQFGLCTTLTDDQWDWFFMWIITSFGNMAMCDYPYASDFLAPLPAWPIKYSCEMMINASEPLLGLIEGVSLFYNGTGGVAQLPCFNITNEYLPCSDQSGCGTGEDGESWDYQACTEIVYFPNTNNVTDMFPPRDWTLSNLTQHCGSVWDVVPRPNWLNTFAGLAQIEQSSRIIFSNGLLDPWHGGGILTNLTDNLVAIIIAEGAHHLDLRGSNPADPISVIQAREQEVSLLTQWMGEVATEKKKKMTK
jgi:dipeptidyl-peptidase-2